VGKQVSSFISGIFIKHVLDNSPAGVNGTLKTGDRILAVNDIDLTQATHDRAVDVIRNAKSPVKFLIQSLIYISTYTPTCDEDVLANDPKRTVSQDTSLPNAKEDIENIENINSGQSDPNKQVSDPNY
jgi:C-terminal processing protease CtpA/Prc